MRRSIRSSTGVKTVSGALLVLVVGLLSILSDDRTHAQDGKSQASIEKAFPNSNKCKRCHERVFEEWETSPLSKSIHSPAFRATLDAFLASPVGKDKALCFRCHAPHVREFPDQVQLFIDQTKSGEPLMDGVACAQCHLDRKSVV